MNAKLVISVWNLVICVDLWMNLEGLILIKNYCVGWWIVTEWGLVVLGLDFEFLLCFLVVDGLMEHDNDFDGIKWKKRGCLIFFFWKLSPKGRMWYEKWCKDFWVV